MRRRTQKPRSSQLTLTNVVQKSAQDGIIFALSGIASAEGYSTSAVALHPALAIIYAGFSYFAHRLLFSSRAPPPSPRTMPTPPASNGAKRTFIVRDKRSLSVADQIGPKAHKLAGSAVVSGRLPIGKSTEAFLGSPEGGAKLRIGQGTFKLGAVRIWVSKYPRYCHSPATQLAGGKPDCFLRQAWIRKC